MTLQQKASAFNKQFFNTVLHNTASTLTKIKKHIKHLLPAPILITTSQVQAAISKANNNNTTGTVELLLFESQQPDNINIRHLADDPC